MSETNENLGSMEDVISSVSVGNLVGDVAQAMSDLGVHVQSESASHRIRIGKNLLNAWRHSEHGAPGWKLLGLDICADSHLGFAWVIERNPHQLKTVFVVKE